jgi:hypothetical protein
MHLLGSSRYLFSDINPSVSLTDLWKNTKNLNENNVFPGRDSNPEPSDYEAGMLTITSHCLEDNERNFLSSYTVYYF